MNLALLRGDARKRLLREFPRYVVFLYDCGHQGSVLLAEDARGHAEMTVEMLRRRPCGECLPVTTSESLKALEETYPLVWKEALDAG